uniref:YdbL family protein n=1 Tax=Marinobacterium profundum TaxID=1714300 RepID=UPI0008341F79|nr:YdbL family protein [Marinobacterium profundum]
MNNTFKSMLSLIALTASLLVTSAWALSLDDAKSQGLIGERSNGYLGIVVSNPSGDVKALVADINSKRKQAYQESASSAGVDLQIIELRIGQRLQQKTGNGQYIQTEAGAWQRK